VVLYLFKYLKYKHLRVQCLISNVHLFAFSTFHSFRFCDFPGLVAFRFIICSAAAAPVGPAVRCRRQLRADTLFPQLKAPAAGIICPWMSEA
jgi:hypothetical protein